MLILNGIYGLSEAEYDEMAKIEMVLHLNLAACCLKLKEFKKAFDNCKLVDFNGKFLFCFDFFFLKALGFDPHSTKAYYRQVQALSGMGQYDEAIALCLTAIQLAPSNR